MDGGEQRTLDELMEVIAYNEAPVTFSGGDPLAQPEPLARLISRIKRELGYNVWCYTGYTWEQVMQQPRLLQAVKELDVLVDSPFVMAPICASAAAATSASSTCKPPSPPAK